MGDYVTLIGAEQMQRAETQITAAASIMSAAAMSIEETMRRHEQFLWDWLEQSKGAVARAPDDKPHEGG